MSKQTIQEVFIDFLKARDIYYRFCANLKLEPQSNHNNINDYLSSTLPENYIGNAFVWSADVVIRWSELDDEWVALVEKRD